MIDITNQMMIEIIDEYLKNTDSIIYGYYDDENDANNYTANRLVIKNSNKYNLLFIEEYDYNYDPQKITLYYDETSVTGVEEIKEYLNQLLL